ncbi:MAG: S9 family peptidase [Gemmatimonadetes bacterium]|nr:S9 family peptidase [Gemmatimonadota bacterium]
MFAPRAVHGALALAMFLAAPLAAQPRSDRLGIEQYLDWEDVQSPRLSPDGKQVIYTRRWIDKLNDRWESSLWTMGVDGTRNRFLVNGGSVEWSPDGQRIAYIASGEPAGSQIFVRWMDAEGAVSQVTRVSEGPSDIQWSPDGKSIAFRMMVPFREQWNLAVPAAPKGAKWVEPPRVVTRLDYRQDRVGFNDGGYNQVFVVSADGGTPRQLTSGEWDHGAPQWMPDGTSIVFTADRVQDAEYRWRESDIYRVDVTSAQITQLTQRKGPDQQPTPSPDGKLIAFTGYDSTDASWIDSKLYVMNADGSNRREISGTLDRSPQGLMWAPDGTGLYFNVENEGSRNLYVASLTGQVRPVTNGTHVLTVSDIGKSGVVLGTLSTPVKPNDVVTFTLQRPDPRQLTSINDDVLTGKKLATTEEIWYTSKDGMRIQGWIVKPPDFNASRKYPLMLEIHGGPHSMYNVGFSFARQEHVGNDFVLLYTNPRGSTGYGSAFGNAIKNAYPDKDFDDLMVGVDSVINRGFVDTKRLYVFGCSGGGVLTAWIVGHTDRFAAASSNCPVTNWMSFVGTTDSPGWYRNFAKPFWEDPSEHLRRSPIMYVGNVKTPTMLMTGVQDLRTPMPQTEEFYEALKFRKVPTAMIRFNNEWHGTSSTPSNFLRTQLYLRSWFDRWPQRVAVQ